MKRLGEALRRDLGVAGIVALTRLQASRYHVTYRGQPLDQVLYFCDPKGTYFSDKNRA